MRHRKKQKIEKGFSPSSLDRLAAETLIIPSGFFSTWGKNSPY
jgi:hypothetical protein